MIPRLIHQMWMGGPMPALWAEYREKLVALHPNWNFRLWTEADLQFRLWHNQTLIDRAEQISPMAPYQFISDVVRYEVLLEFGGVWVDIDFDPQKPLDELCNGKEAWVAYEDGVWVNNAVMGMAQEHPVMREAVDGLAGNVGQFRPSVGNTHKSGPQYLTPLILAHEVHIYPKEYFYPYLWNELDREGELFPDAYMVHRWANRRKRIKP